MLGNNWEFHRYLFNLAHICTKLKIKIELTLLWVDVLILGSLY